LPIEELYGFTRKSPVLSKSLNTIKRER